MEARCPPCSPAATPEPTWRCSGWRARGPPWAPPGEEPALRVGHMVLAIGYGPRASWGVISALGPRWRSWRGGDIDRLVRLDLVLYPGFSGGPLVDAAGRVVG